MLAYFLSAENLSIQDIVPVVEYTINVKARFDGRSIVKLPRMPNVSQYRHMPFVVLKSDDNRELLKGVLNTAAGNDGETSKTAQINQMETLFAGNIALTGTELLATGIEDFVKKAIEDNFSNSGDALIDMSYITVTAATHSPTSAIPENNRGIYDLSLYLSSIMLNNGIFLDFAVADNRLNISISKKVQMPFAVDAKTSDVTNYSEILNADVISKVKAIWDNDGEITDRTFYLLSDMTFTEKVSASNRVNGKSTTINVVAKTLAEVEEQVKNEFLKNRYDHAINMDILASSKLYPKEEIYVGHTCKVATRENGIYDTIISTVTLSNTTNLISVKFGRMPATLLEIIKEGK